MTVARSRGAETSEQGGIVSAKDDRSAAILEGAMADIATYFGIQGGAAGYRQTPPASRRELIERLRAELRALREGGR